MCPSKVPSFTDEEHRFANKEIKIILKKSSSSDKHRKKYNDYTPEEKARIGRYAAENGPARAVQHCSKEIGKSIPETTARRLKLEYLLKMKATC